MDQSVNTTFWERSIEWRYHAAVMVALAFLLVPAATYYISFTSFKSKNHNRTGTVPTIPYLIPLVGHSRLFALGDTTLASALL